MKHLLAIFLLSCSTILAQSTGNVRNSYWNGTQYTTGTWTGSGVLGITGTTPFTYSVSGTTQQILSSDIDPWVINYANQTFIFEGDSITLGVGTAVQPVNFTPFGYYFSQLPFALNHGTYRNFAVGSSFIPSGAGGPLSSPVTGTMTTTNGSTAAILISGSIAGLSSGGSMITGNGIPYGTDIATVTSGTNITLRFSATASGTTTVTIGPNNITDRYNTYVRPHRPTANGGDGGSRAFLFIHIGTNDANSGSYTSSQIANNIASYVATATADGFYVIVSTILPRNFIGGWAYNQEGIRIRSNDLIRSGQAGVTISRVWDCARLFEMDSVHSSDGLHPNAFASSIMANDLNNFMTANGGAIARYVYNTESLQARRGVVLSPLNQGIISDNLTLLANPGSADTFFTFSATGNGSAWVSISGETQWFSTGTTGVAGANSGAQRPKIKFSGTNGFAFGGTLSGVSGDMSGANLFFNSNGSITSSGSMSVANGIRIGATATAAYISGIFTGTTTLNIASLAATSGTLALVPVPGATSTNTPTIDIGVSGTITSGLIQSGPAFVPASGTVAIPFYNTLGIAASATNQVIRATVIQP